MELQIKTGKDHNPDFVCPKVKCPRQKEAVTMALEVYGEEKTD